jgi:hypothetical protein
MIDPARYFEIKGQVETLNSHYAQITVGSNYAVKAGVVGKKIRIMGLIAQGIGGVSAVVLKDGNGGNFLFGPFNIASSGTPDVLFLPVVHSGYFETSTGIGVFADCAGVAATINLFYVEYAP